MNECRDDFEKWLKTYDKNQVNSIYFHQNDLFAAWQARQQEIDQLSAANNAMHEAIANALVMDAKEGYGMHPVSVKLLVNALSEIKK